MQQTYEPADKRMKAAYAHTAAFVQGRIVNPT